MNDLTRERIAEMPAGRELDALVAEHVMGFRWEPALYTQDRYLLTPAGDIAAEWTPEDGLDVSVPELPFFSVDIGAAWPVLKLRRSFSERRQFYAELGRLCQEQTADGTGERIRVAWPDAIGYLTPLVICRAALLTTLPAGHP